MQRAKYTHLSNEELLGLYQDADVEAFEEFFRRTKGLVYNFLLSKLHNRADADDAFQRTFLKIHRYVASYDVQKPALSWVFTIARNTALDVRTGRRDVAVTDTEVVDERVEGQAVEAKSTLISLMKMLTPEEQKLLESKFLYENDYETIARENQISVANARQRVSRLVKRLKLAFDPSLTKSIPSVTPAFS